MNVTTHSSFDYFFEFFCDRQLYILLNHLLYYMTLTKTPYRVFNNENGTIAIFSFIDYDVVSWKLKHEDTYHTIKSRQYRTVNALFELIKARLTQ